MEELEEPKKRKILKGGIQDEEIEKKVIKWKNLKRGRHWIIPYKQLSELALEIMNDYIVLEASGVPNRKYSWIKHHWLHKYEHYKQMADKLFNDDKW